MGSEQRHSWDNHKVNHPTHFRLMCSRRGSSHLFSPTGSTSAETYKTRGVFHAYNTSHWIFLSPTINSLLLVVKALDQSHIQPQNRAWSCTTPALQATSWVVEPSDARIPAADTELPVIRTSIITSSRILAKEDIPVVCADVHGHAPGG